MENIFRWFEKLQKIIMSITGLLLVIMLSVVFLQTFTRYVIFYSLPWSEELSRYLFTAIILLGINVAVTRHMFVRIDVVDNFVKGKAARVLETIRYIIMLFVSGVLFYSTFDLVRIGQYQVSPAMRIPMVFIYMFLLIGFLLSTISIILEIIKFITIKEEV